jgi:hypothetical protein
MNYECSIDIGPTVEVRHVPPRRQAESCWRRVKPGVWSAWYRNRRRWCFGFLLAVLGVHQARAWRAVVAGSASRVSHPQPPLKYDVQRGSQAASPWPISGDCKQMKVTARGWRRSYSAHWTPPKSLARQPPPSWLQRCYLASLLVIDDTSFMERAYLDEFARQVKLPQRSKPSWKSRPMQTDACPAGQTAG